MIPLTFIVTTYNVAPYLRQCLDSVLSVARPGDEVIIVDDGSTDDSLQILDGMPGSLPEGHPVKGKVAWDAPAGPDQVHWRTVRLGVNTHGGVGIAANIGLSMARSDGVFFVDGDDWIDQGGFNAARAVFENGEDEVVIANYLEHDEETQTSKRPADTPRWATVGAIEHRAPQPAGAEASLERRTLALSLIAVPWRKFYRRDLLERHGLRFPEGDFFFEDNPFHWDVCLNAARIGFCNQVICYHRVKRDGQTMMVNDTRLSYFFTHFDTILAKLPALDAGLPEAEALHVAVQNWLVANMTWHLDRLDPLSYWDYALRAKRALDQFDTHLWDTQVAPAYAGTAIGAAVAQLREGPVTAAVALWHQEARLRSEQSGGTLAERLERVETKADALATWLRMRIETDLDLHAR